MSEINYATMSDEALREYFLEHKNVLLDFLLILFLIET